MLNNNRFQWKSRCISIALCVFLSQSSNALDHHLAKQGSNAATSDKTTATVETTSDTITSDKKRHTPRAVNISKKTIQNHFKALSSQAVICKQQASIGSRIPKSVCKTVAEFNQEILDQHHSGAGINPKRFP